MIKLKNILTEVLNTFQVEAIIVSDKKVSITSVLDQIRALHKITIVNNITPDDYAQKNPNTEVHKLKIKFVTREDPKNDIIQLKKDMISSDFSSDHKHLRVAGLKTVTFKQETIKRL